MRNPKHLWLALLAAAGLLFAPKTSVAANPKAKTPTLAARALEILDARCSECHDDLARSGLNVLDRATLIAGGEHGKAVIPGKSASSSMIPLLRHQTKPTMPPGEAPLTEAEIQTLESWIDAGLPWPEGREGAGNETPQDKRWWSLKTPVRPTVPVVGKTLTTWVKSPIDAFIAKKLEDAKLHPAAIADRRTLIRRATFDLHGLPPTEDDVRAFEADSAPDAFAKLVDRLLASPRYGEKWGRYWLDLARYGDSSGYEQDPYLLDAWRYRDYVIESFNEDKPYDRFIREQIAGDELWPEDPQAQRGTGFYTVGPNRDMLFKVEDTNRIESLSDFVDTTSSLFMGLSVGCARCHDHKFDPISQKDYFKLQAIFAPAVKNRIFLDYNGSRFWDISENYRQFKLRDLAAQIARTFEPYTKILKEKKKAALPPEVRAAFDTEESKRSQEQQGMVNAFHKALDVSSDEVRILLNKNAIDRAILDGIERDLVNMYAGFSPPPMAPGIHDLGRQADATYMPVRNQSGPGVLIRPGFPDALGGGIIPEPEITATSTGRRKALAEWLTQPSHPLTARVMINRVWHGHFARGLITTPSDMGRRGTLPTHPELLDYLATEFVAQKYSFKAMHRLMMNSAVYQTITVADPEALKQDPENRLLSHMNRRRLGAEEIRDAVLSSSGTLNLAMGGPPVVPPLPTDELFGLSVPIPDAWVVSRNPAQHTRRSVYLIRKRGFQQPLFEVFDAPDGALHCPRRESSTMAPQSLSLLNGSFTQEQSAAFAKRILHESAKTKRDPVDRAFAIALLRQPTADERVRIETFLKNQTAQLGSRPRAFSELGRVLFNLNEFLYID
jgi:Protein of unknown function (DUF1553)/Protein of unknown function (DUF1549)/Planctomycete cytochrome C